MKRTRAADTAISPAVRWTGRVASCVGFLAWSAWLAWRVSSSNGPIGAVVLVLEVAALLVAVVLSAALWSVPDRRGAVSSCSTLGRRARSSVAASP